MSAFKTMRHIYTTLKKDDFSKFQKRCIVVAIGKKRSDERKF